MILRLRTLCGCTRWIQVGGFKPPRDYRLPFMAGIGYEGLTGHSKPGGPDYREFIYYGDEKIDGETVHLYVER